MAATTSPTTVAVEGLGQVAVDLELGLVYPLTSCCGASAKGSGSGVVCRACYHAVPSSMGMGWSLDEAADALFCGECGDLLGRCCRSPLYGKGDSWG